MRRWLLLILALAVTPAFSAVETTRVEGFVLNPSGGAHTGTIVCTLSSAGSTDDLTTGETERVASKYSTTIASSGAVSFALVPNDAITPANTTYACVFTVGSGATRSSWTETWSVVTSPDPIDIGDITRTGTLALGPADPSNCGTGQKPAGIDGNGTVQSCSGPFAAGAADAGNALALYGDVRSAATLALRGTTGAEIDANGDNRGDLTIDAIGNVGISRGLQLGDAPSMKITLVDRDHDGMRTDPVWFEDLDADGSWTPGERFNVNRWEYVEEFYDCSDIGYIDADGDGSGLSSQVPYRYWGYMPTLLTNTPARAEGEPTLNTYGVSTGGTICYCNNTSPGTVRLDCGVLIHGVTQGSYAANAGGNSSYQHLVAGKLRYFRARIGSINGGWFGRWIVGGYRSSGNGQLLTVTDGIYFTCNTRDDPDGDGATADGDNDRNWFVVTASNAANYCRQLLDGNGDGLLDCDLSGSGETPLETANFTATNTGLRCMDGTGWTFNELAIGYDDTTIKFWINDILIAEHSSDIPSSSTRKLAGWGTWAENTTTGAGNNDLMAIDYLYYLGRR